MDQVAEFENHLIRCKELFELAVLKGWSVEEFKRALRSSTTLTVQNGSELESTVIDLSKKIESLTNGEIPDELRSFLTSEGDIQIKF